MKFVRSLRVVAAFFAALWLSSARADDGHDHGAAPQASGPALPRFAAVSDQFELVGVVNGKLLTLYLDEAATNAPVKDAKLDIELGGVKIDVRPHGEGEFEAALTADLPAGVTTVTATVTTTTDSDLLAGEIDIHEEAHVDAPPARTWSAFAPWVAGGLLVLGAVWWAVRQRRRAARSDSMAVVGAGSAA